MAVPDRTNQPFESVKHEHPHGHPRPVPHLARRLDDHGPDVAHPHVHQQGGGRTYDHHAPGGIGLDGHDSINDLKPDHGAADNNGP